MFSFGYFPRVWGLKADVSEPSIGSNFLEPQTPGKYPKENILHKELGESLKRDNNSVFRIIVIPAITRRNV